MSFICEISNVSSLLPEYILNQTILNMFSLMKIHLTFESDVIGWKIEKKVIHKEKNI